MVGRPRSSVHGDQACAALSAGDDQPLVVVDQFEELFSLDLSQIELEEFGELLQAHLQRGGGVLVTLR
ncbi:hypothetical protein GCM10009776_22860 [Microbacterium deminutum]|uniref:Uncharacterized protein n=1 Tax=Microbacterium deminutum TaxID=344164 RepID=A0ABN2QX69_9MICO